MSRLRCYIAPFDDAGNFKDFEEVTEDITFSSMTTINQQIDNDEYSVGQVKFNEFTLQLRNDHGRYSDVDVLQSMFRFRRAGSKLRMQWETVDEPPQCGLAVAGASVGATLNNIDDIFIGVINDEATRLDIDDQRISFKVLSTDSIFPSVEAPFGDLFNGQLYSEALLAILDQEAITKYLTVDAANINVSLDQAMDDVSGFENQTVKEVMDDILFQSNSVMFVKDETIFIKSRAGGDEIKYTFRGQGSNKGIEDIQKISNVATGINQVYNYWTWKDTTLLAVDGDSVVANGVRKNEIDFPTITNISKRQAVLDAQRDEFRNKKMSFDIDIPINNEVLQISLLDQVRVDYPTTYIPGELGGIIPLYGVSRYGEAVYPKGQFALTIDETTEFKVMGIKKNTKSQTIQFRLKER